MGGWFNKEINGPDDYKGLKMRIPGLGGEVVKGPQVATSSTCRVVRSLQPCRRVRSTPTEWVGPYNDLAFGLYKSAKFYYYPGWHDTRDMPSTISSTSPPGRSCRAI